MLPFKGKLLVLLLSLVLPAGVIYAGETPGLLSPENNSSTSSTKVEWNPVSYALYSSNPYRVQIDDDSNFLSPDKDTNTKNTNYTPQNLEFKTWYWRVKAKDESGVWSDWSGSWSFTLTSATPTPSPTPTPAETTTSSFFQISSIPSSINSDQSFQTKVEISGLTPNTKYYLKGAFYKSGSSNYFGKTKVGSDWIKNSSTYSNQLAFTSDNDGKFNQNIEIMPDSDDSGLSGSGSYLFKVARYTSSGSGPTWSNEQSININLISASISQSSSSKTPSPTPMASTTIVTKTSTSSTSSTVENSIVHSIPELTPEPEVAGENIENKIEVKNKSFLNWGFIAAGFMALAIGGGTFYLVKKDLIPF